MGLKPISANLYFYFNKTSKCKQTIFVCIISNFKQYATIYNNFYLQNKYFKLTNQASSFTPDVKLLFVQTPITI
jgi:hypothetical protein